MRVNIDSDNGLAPGQWSVFNEIWIKIEKNFISWKGIQNGICKVLTCQLSLYEMAT